MLKLALSVEELWTLFLLALSVEQLWTTLVLEWLGGNQLPPWGFLADQRHLEARRLTQKSNSRHESPKFKKCAAECGNGLLPLRRGVCELPADISCQPPRSCVELARAGSHGSKTLMGGAQRVFGGEKKQKRGDPYSGWTKSISHHLETG